MAIAYDWKSTSFSKDRFKLFVGFGVQAQEGVWKRGGGGGGGGVGFVGGGGGGGGGLEKLIETSHGATISRRYYLRDWLCKTNPIFRGAFKRHLRYIYKVFFPLTSLITPSEQS